MAPWSPVAGEYRALAIDAAGVATRHIQVLQDTLTATQARLAAHQLTGLTADDVTGQLLYSTVLSYFATNDAMGRLSAAAAGMVEYRRPSFGSFTVKVQPHLLFGMPRTVSFAGLELDITRLESLIVSTTHNRAAQMAYVLQRGLWQSALEHRLPEQLFTDAQHPGEAVSAVKALTVASHQGQRLYTLTQDTVATALPQLTIAPEVQADIQEAVATGKVALVSQHEVTVGGWTGVGYLLLDLETGAGAYLIAGGINGGYLAYLRDNSNTFGAALFVVGLDASLPGIAPVVVTLVLAVTAMANILIALATVDGLLDYVTSPESYECVQRLTILYGALTLISIAAGIGLKGVVGVGFALENFTALSNNAFQEVARGCAKP